MKKRFLAVLLTSAMIMGMSLTAGAEGIDGLDDMGAEKTLNGTAAVQEPTIEVNVPTTLAIAVNPYQVPYVASDGKTYQDKVVSVPAYIANYSDIPITVKITDARVAKVKPASTVQVVNTVADDATAKQIALALNVTAATYKNKVFVKSTAEGATKTAKFIAANVEGQDPVDYGAAIAVGTLAPATPVSKTATVRAEVEDPVITYDSSSLVKTVVGATTEVDGKYTQVTTTYTPTVYQLEVAGDLVAKPEKVKTPATEAVGTEGEEGYVPATPAVMEADEWSTENDALTLSVKYVFTANVNEVE
jgi:hypothetical protein